MCSVVCDRDRGHCTLESQCERDITSNVRALSRTATVNIDTILFACFQLKVVTR